MRLTHASVAVLRALLDDPEAYHYGYDLILQTGVCSGVIYPILWRMVDAGWLADGWEDQGAEQEYGRPRRRYYQLTGEGLAELGAMAGRASTDRRFS